MRFSLANFGDSYVRFTLMTVYIIKKICFRRCIYFMSTGYSKSREFFGISVICKLMKVEICRLHKKNGNEAGFFVKKPKRIGSIVYILDHLMSLQFD